MSGFSITPLNLADSIYPEMLKVGETTLPVSAIIGTVLVAVILLLCYLVKRNMKHWQDEPKGVQNLIEGIVETVHKFARDKIHAQADSVAPLTLTFIAYILLGTCVELFGLPPITKDINCAIALALTSFVMVNATALRCLGLKRRFQNLASPMPAVLPIKMLTDLIAPLSMTLRLFANILVGFLIMHLIYSFFPVILPGVLSVYFTLLHSAIQSYVFGTLNLNYLQEALE